MEITRVWRTACLCVAVVCLLSIGAGYVYAQCEDSQQYGEYGGCHESLPCQEFMGITVSWCTEALCDNRGLCPNGEEVEATAHCHGLGCSGIPAEVFCIPACPIQY